MKKNGSQETDFDQVGDFQYGKLPPQAIDLEEAVLGAVLIDRDAIGVVTDILTPEMMYATGHQLILAACLKLYTKYSPIDILTVTEELKKSNELEEAGGPAYLASLTNRVASAANIEYHSRIIYQKYIRRELIRISSKLNKDAFDNSVDDFDLLEQAESSLFRITGNLQGQTIKSSESISKLLFDMKNRILEQPEGVIGVPSGLQSIDLITNGFQEPDLWIIAARPGMGKSALITSIARQQAVFRNIPVGIFSLEMSAEQHQRRIAAAEADIPNSVCQDPRKMTPYQLQAYDAALDRIGESPIYYNDTPGISIMQLKSKAREMVRKHGVKIIYIDYLQLMSGGDENQRGGNREQEVSKISRGLKALAKELCVPVIALSQLSRAVEIRGGDKRPQLSDLRESGSLEQDADNVAFLYRPEYYGITEDADGKSLKGICEFILAKHRNGKLATIPVQFIDTRVLFQDLPEYDFDDMPPIKSEPDNFITSRANTDEGVPF